MSNAVRKYYTFLMLKLVARWTLLRVAVIRVTATVRRHYAPWTLPRLKKWKTFTIGIMSPGELWHSVWGKASDYVGDLFKAAFPVLFAEEDVDTIKVTLAEFYKREPTSEELAQMMFNSDWLASWCRRHPYRLPKGCVLELLPLEAGPHIGRDYTDQPLDEVLHVATRLTIGLRGFVVFTVERRSDGPNHKDRQWLCAWPLKVGERWPLKTVFVFRLRKESELRALRPSLAAPRVFETTDSASAAA